MQRVFFIILATLLISACGSTKKEIKAPTQTVNNGIAKMVHFGILDAELADMMALKADKAKVNQNNVVKDSALSALTDEGNLVTGYMLSSVLGAGLSLSDFLSPSNILLSGFSGSKRKTPSYDIRTFFAEIELSCDEQCAVDQIKEFVKEVYARFAEKAGLPDDKIIRVVEKKYLSASRGYFVETESGKMIRTLIIGLPEKFNHKGKTYYGSNPTLEKYSGKNTAGWEFSEYADITDIGFAALIEASEDFPYMFTYHDKKSFRNNSDGLTRPKGCRGNFIIQGGKLELMYQMFGCHAFASEKWLPKDRVIVYQ
ncbi:hypothetical protein ACOI22_09730 [Glaciecola sp. 2405UD65-10]|uniref:hypothetical protein n=1 Tax=Glaciecola sp. 2405UD65-10 TaxID=3397244 RepID=UPI003B5A16BE